MSERMSDERLIEIINDFNLSQIADTPMEVLAELRRERQRVAELESDASELQDLRAMYKAFVARANRVEELEAENANLRTDKDRAANYIAELEESNANTRLAVEQAKREAWAEAAKVAEGYYSTWSNDIRWSYGNTGKIMADQVGAAIRRRAGQPTEPKRRWHVHPKEWVPDGPQYCHYETERRKGERRQGREVLQHLAGSPMYSMRRFWFTGKRKADRRRAGGGA